MTDPFTMQEAFDTAYLGVVRQGRPSRGNYGGLQSCLYRGPGGLKCAMGFLIDDKTAKNYEGQDAECVASYYLGWSQGLSELAGSLQDAHDTAPSDDGFLPSFKKKAAQVAVRFGLTVPPDPAP